MHLSRRSLLGGVVAAGTAGCLLARKPGRMSTGPPLSRFDPWIEVDTANLYFNVRQISRLAGERPILAVVKNDAYGLGLELTARVLEKLPQVMGFAVVKTSAAIRLREAGIEKPVLLMGMCSTAEAHELVANEVELSLYTNGAAERLAELSRKAGRPIPAHFYLDTGLGRMGMPYHRALPWLEQLAARSDLAIRGTFMAFTEEPDFDREQLARFLGLAESARGRGVELGPLHAASSNAVFHLPEAHLDLVRPGIALYGAYPSRPDEERAKGELRPALRLRARIVRVARLRKGDTAGYGRKYVAKEPTWLATLPAGHTDGVPRKSVDGGRVLIGGRTFPIVGAVSASHCLVALGAEKMAEVGDVVTFVGPDHPDIHPNALATRTGVSVYDVLMHLNPRLPRYAV